ncbi:MAG: xylose operon regulatory protein [Gemmataceae bacterium]|nr:xylose operon regulatory protein [Gemmataceae bacterium]
MRHADLRRPCVDLPGWESDPRLVRPATRPAGEAAPGLTPRRVTLSFPLRLGPWPDIVRGVYRYGNAVGGWAISLNVEEDVGVALAARPDGVIAMVRTAAAAVGLRAWGGPVVDTAYDLDDLPFARVGLDPIAVGQTAADHLLRLNRRRFGYVGDAATPTGRRVGEGFVGRLRRAGFGCEVAPPGVFDCPYQVNAGGERAAAEWLSALPRPAAVFAAHDALAHRLAEACRTIGLRVPEDVALLGALNDEFLCTAAQPPLSSVGAPLVAVGYEAARVLDGLMAGGPPPAGRIEIPPFGVVGRRSTDPTAVPDPDLAAALRFIRDHATERVGVDQIAAAGGLSRSSLERRFRATLGHGPLAEVLRQRVDRARYLLAETDLTVKEVARAAGFSDARHLSVTFRHKTGLSPVQFRATFRPG